MRAFNNRLYTCPLCRLELHNILNKIGFKFPPAEPEQITDLDLDLIYRLLESSNYYPTTGMDMGVADTSEEYYHNYSLLDLYRFGFII